MAKKQSTTSQILIAGVLIVTGLYVVCFIGLTLAQRKLIYYPCTRSAAATEPTAERQRFQRWENAKGDFIGWVRLSPSSNAAAKILLLHGNAGCASDWFHYAEGFQAVQSYDFYILEYPGYGGRRGSPSKSSILAAADEALATIPQPCSIFLVGESLGTGPACYLAGKNPQVKGVFLVAPYNNLSAAAQEHLPLFPVKWMLWDNYVSDQWLENYEGRLAVLLAADDNVIPSDLGQKLYDGYTGPKKLWIERGATHDDVHRPRSEIYREVTAFWFAD